MVWGKIVPNFHIPAVFNPRLRNLEIVAVQTEPIATYYITSLVFPECSKEETTQQERKNVKPSEERAIQEPNRDQAHKGVQKSTNFLQPTENRSTFAQPLLLLLLAMKAGKIKIKNRQKMRNERIFNSAIE